MNMIDPVAAVAPTRGVGPHAPGTMPTPAQREVPPELASRFQALMARVDSPVGGESSSLIPQVAVAKVEGHLETYSRSLDDVMKVSDGQMSLIDLQALQIRSIAEVGVMSMTHAAYVQVLGAGKGSVSSLMKNQ